MDSLFYVMWSDEILIFHYCPHMEPKWWFVCLFVTVRNFNTVGIVSLEFYLFRTVFVRIVELLELFDLVEIHRTG